MYDDRHRKNTYASPSAATDGKLVYFFFESGGLLAYDVDGNAKWHVSLGGIAKAGMGPGTSPVIFENLVIVQCDQEMGEGGSFIAAFDRFTGREVWRSAAEEPAKLGDAAHRHDGWGHGTHRVGRRSGDCVRPADRARALAHGRHEGASDSKLGRRPRTGLRVRRQCRELEDGDRVPAGRPAGGETAHVSSGNTRAARRMSRRRSSYGDYLYLLTDNGITTCLDARTGAVQYLGGRPPVPATFTASPVAFGDKILLTSEDGDTFVLRAGPTHEIVRTNSIGEPVYASLALANGRVYIRGERHLFAIK